MAYDTNNIFARLLRGEIPANKVYETEHALAFHDIRPLAPVHVLVIPKGHYTDLDDFTARASPAEIAGFFAAGYRILTNTGANAHQEVPHMHVHVFAGRPLGPMLKRAE